VAASHASVTIRAGPSSSLHLWDTCSRYAGTFTTIATHQVHNCKPTDNQEGRRGYFRHNDRVRRIGFDSELLAQGLRRLIMAWIFFILEYMYIQTSRLAQGQGSLVLPKGSQAPHLHYLILRGPVHPPIGSPSLWVLSPFELSRIPPSEDFHAGYLLIWISLMSQLQELIIRFLSHLPNCNVEKNYPVSRS
jgi:hypothetical protein